MKKNAYISAVMLILALTPSCESTLDLGEDGLGGVLLMNAQMCTGDTTHTIWLSRNSIDLISSAPGATVSCYVNDRMVYQTRKVEITDEHSFLFNSTVFKSSGYKIHARFNPEDRVCIKADLDGHHCETHLVVPRAPIIKNATTDEGRYVFSIQVQDLKSEYNYYSLNLYSEGCVIVEETADPRAILSPGDTVIYEKKNVWIDTKGEPLLNSGARTISNPGSTQESFFDNTDNLFTDLLFRDGEYEMRVTTPKERYFTRPKQWSTGDRFIGYNKAIIRINSHSTEEYVYLTGCEYIRSIEGNSAFSEPFFFPSNVEGGLGFVSVSASSDYIINFPPKRFESIDDLMDTSR